jgi:hypothetical protein
MLDARCSMLDARCSMLDARCDKTVGPVPFLSRDEWTKIRNPNPPAAAVADQASSEEGGHEPPAGDGVTRRPEADSKSEFRNLGPGGRIEYPVSRIEYPVNGSRTGDGTL